MAFFWPLDNETNKTKQKTQKGRVRRGEVALNCLNRKEQPPPKKKKHVVCKYLSNPNTRENTIKNGTPTNLIAPPKWTKKSAQCCVLLDTKFPKRCLKPYFIVFLLLLLLFFSSNLCFEKKKKNFFTIARERPVLQEWLIAVNRNQSTQD